MDYVLLSSNDGELLKKAHQMLLEGGVKDNVDWNNKYNPDDGYWDIISLYIFCTGPKHMSFHNHNCDDALTKPAIINITNENLTESVNTVLAAYREAQNVQP